MYLQKPSEINRYYKSMNDVGISSETETDGRHRWSMGLARIRSRSSNAFKPNSRSSYSNYANSTFLDGSDPSLYDSNGRKYKEMDPFQGREKAFQQGMKIKKLNALKVEEKTWSAQSRVFKMRQSVPYELTQSEPKPRIIDMQVLETIVENRGSAKH